MGKKDFKAGQNVYLRINIGSNAARHIDKSNKDAWIIEKVVKSVGKKYITVTNNIDDKWGEIKFDVTNDFRQVYTYGGADYSLYLSKQDIYDDMECERLYGKIRDKFSGWNTKENFSLEQLQLICEIINQ